MKIIIRDLDAALVAAAGPIMAGLPEVSVAEGSALDVACDAVATPGNSFGFMDGGFDAACRTFFGAPVEDAVGREIGQFVFGELPVGLSVTVKTGHAQIPHLILAPTMRVPKPIADPAAVMLAARAAVCGAQLHGLETIVMPGFGTGTGKIAPEIAALAMRSGIEMALTRPPRAVNWRDALARHNALRG